MPLGGSTGPGLGSPAASAAPEDPPFLSPRARSVSLPDLAEAAAAAAPGDVLFVRGGAGSAGPRVIYLPGGPTGDQPTPAPGIEIKASGTPEAPVWIAAEEPGALRLAGSSLLVTGSNVRLWGFAIEDGAVAAAGAGVKILRHTFGPTPADGAAVMLSGPGGEVGYCLLHDVQRWGIRCNSPAASGSRIHHCHFRDAKGPPNANEHEMLQLGMTNNAGGVDAKMVAEWNLFQNCAVDLECISIKSWGATVRYNTLDSSHSISNRHGRRNQILANTLLGSRIILLGGPGVCAWNAGDSSATLEPTWGDMTQDDADKGKKGYAAAVGWRLWANHGLRVTERNPGGGRRVKPQYDNVKPDSAPMQAKRLTPADVGPGAK